MQKSRIALAVVAMLVLMGSAFPALSEPASHRSAASLNFASPTEPNLVKPREVKISSPASEQDLSCLAETIYWEAGNESRAGQRAVAHVVLNRVGRAGFANSICGVVHQGARTHSCQFRWSCAGASAQAKNPAKWKRMLTVASQALGEADNTNGAIYFHQAKLGRVLPSGHYREARVIGNHIFLR